MDTHNQPLVVPVDDDWETTVSPLVNLLGRAHGGNVHDVEVLVQGEPI